MLPSQRFRVVGCICIPRIKAVAMQDAARTPSEDLRQALSVVIRNLIWTIVPSLELEGSRLQPSSPRTRFLPDEPSVRAHCGNQSHAGRSRLRDLCGRIDWSVSQQLRRARTPLGRRAAYLHRSSRPNDSGAASNPPLRWNTTPKWWCSCFPLLCRTYSFL